MKNIEEIIKEIESKYTADDILELLDEEVLNWDYGYDESEIDEYPSRWDFYIEYANKEAEDAVVNQILNSIGLDSNALFKIDDGVSFYLFMDWLEEYTSHYFN
jgi:hypothetical protein